VVGDPRRRFYLRLRALAASRSRCRSATQAPPSQASVERAASDRLLRGLSCYLARLTSLPRPQQLLARLPPASPAKFRLTVSADSPDPDGARITSGCTPPTLPVGDAAPVLPELASSEVPGGRSDPPARSATLLAHELRPRFGLAPERPFGARWLRRPFGKLPAALLDAESRMAPSTDK
jgi:hypothetical protein